MHRVDADGHLNNAFTDGNDQTGVEPTTLGAKWHNSVQEEIANVVEAVGDTLDAADNTQLITNLIPHVAGITALRALTPVNGRRYYLDYHTTAGDGGHGVFRGVTGAAASTYTHNNGTIVVPSGGDGSAAWVRDMGETTVSKTANFSVEESQNATTFLCDATSGTITATLPSAVTAGAGFICSFVKSDSGTNKVVVDGNGSEEVGEVSSITLRTEAESVQLLSDATKWHVVSRRFNAHIGQLSDGALVISSVPANFDVGSGTSAGCIIIEHNRFYRTFNNAGTGTIRLLGINNSDHVVISGEPVTSKVIVDSDELLLQRNTGGEQSLAVNRDAGSAAASDVICTVAFRRLGTEYGNIKFLVSDATSSAEDGRMTLNLRRGGVSTTMIDIDTEADATNPIKIYVNGAEKRVDVGAADSGGAGYRVLRVPN